MSHFRFQNAGLQAALRRLYDAAGIAYETGDDGSLRCGEAFETRAEALRSAVRSQRFARWQTFCVSEASGEGDDFREAVLAHLAERAIPFEVEESDGECWLLLPEDEVVPESLWESVYGSAEVCPRINPECCFCRETIEGEAFGEISVRQPDGAFRSVLYAHLACLGSRVHPQAAPIVAAAGGPSVTPS